MNPVCPKCSYERGPDEIVPEYECPRCGVVYQKYLEWLEKYGPGSGAIHPAPQAASEGESRATESDAGAEPPRAPTTAGPLQPYSNWRFIGLILALIIVAAIAAVTTHERLQQSVCGHFPYDIRGTWRGSVSERLSLRDHSPYEAEYAAKFVVDEHYRLTELEWTAGHSLLKKETVYWKWPRTLSYTSQRRNGVSGAFIAPPGGEYTQLLLDGETVSVESRQNGPNAAKYLEAEFSLPSGKWEGSWSDGVFARLRKEGALEAIARGGLPRFNRVELDSDAVSLELPASAAAVAFRPYLRGSKPWPVDTPDDPSTPCEGLELENVGILDLSAIKISIDRVRAQFASGAHGRSSAAATEREDWVQLLPESRVALVSSQAQGWSAHVLFFADGRVVVRLPNRDLEIPMNRIDDEPLTDQTETNEP